MAENLNESQRAAVTTHAGPLLVLAGAGTGKTRVVTHRIAELIRSGTAPHRILAVTFTNKAAGEMQQRAGHLLDKRLRSKPEVSTFHSLCVRILRRNHRALGLPSRFAIYDRADQEMSARAALREIKVPGAALQPSALLGWISRWKTEGVDPVKAAAAADTDREHLAASAYRRYERALQVAGAVDFDDLLLRTESLFRKHSEARSKEAARFDHVLIDEYQDTNRAQYELVKALAAGHRNLCVVGDDDQSIYGWRGADVRHILRFQEDWPDAKIIRLERNYRTTTPILEMANRLIAFNTTRHVKSLNTVRDGKPPRVMVLDDTDDEAKQVAGDIAGRLERRVAQPRDFAVLFRTNDQPGPFEIEFRRAEVPYVLVGGKSFYDRKEVRDVLAYLNLLVQPKNEVALLRVINSPPRGIGRASVKKLLDESVDRGVPLWDLLGKAGGLSDLTASTVAAIGRFRRLMGKARQNLRRVGPSKTARWLLGEINFFDDLERIYSNSDDRASRQHAVEEILRTLRRHDQGDPHRGLAEYLDRAALADRDDEKEREKQLNRNAVTLMTLHSAKGLEFPHVYLVGMEEGLLPHQRSIEDGGTAVDEERRLCYVGVTRAQDELTLACAKIRYKWGKPRATQPSRFLYELTGKQPKEEEKQVAATTRRRARVGASARAKRRQY